MREPFNYFIKSNTETVSKWGLFSLYKRRQNGNRKEIFSKRYKSPRLKQL